MSTVALRVPYITAYTAEETNFRLGFCRYAGATDGWRLSYRDAVSTDWMFGVLWARQGLSRQGRPEWKLVHTLRQRRAMLHDLCQVCGRTAVDPDTGRLWWLLAEEAPDPARVNAPPTCHACIPYAAAYCPRLRGVAHVYTVASAAPFGVIGDVFTRCGDGALLSRQDTDISLEAYRKLEYTLARQLVVELDDVRPERAP